MKEQTLLPNGSIVILKEGEKKLVIYGRKQILALDEPILYDYLACPYPEGYISPEFSYVFNHEDIAEVIFTGYTDGEEEKFQEVLAEA
ncbi:DUF4176 domain-containing protein [Paenibacillus ihbetae]|uniref:Cytoplasmic protein n=1 Tax=Paenibacillus ihbetae TaxID=1870820 RepID=A0ABX3JSB5_9BACL|nr:DUF4176 domain-containing protein [Paenibacillus ihbetae]OOC60582.1 cytoplasmic protein [Paenibacillus ihbetae]